MPRHRSTTLLVLIGVLFCLSISNSVPTAAVTPHSLSLNGSNAYMSVANSTSLNITGPITVEAWIKTNSTAQQGIVERYGPGANGGYALRISSGGYLQFFTLIGGSSFDYIQSTVSVSTGAWHHVAGVFDGSQLRVYIDGTQRGSKSSTFAPGTGTNTVKIGARGDDAAAKFNGLIDEVRITAGILYTGGFAPAVDLAAITGCKGLWKFDGQTTSDSSGNGNGGTLQGSATYSTEVCDIPPTVEVTLPASGATFAEPASLTVSANATDSDGTIASVEFYQGSTSIGSDTSTPYSITWNNVAAGNYSLTARATDNFGAITTSSAVNVIVSSSSGSITGKVTRPDGTTAIANASVKVYQGTTIVGTTTTNTTGDYTVGTLGNGTYSVQASAAGYETSAQIAASVSEGTATTLNISLSVPITYLYDQLGRLVSVIDKDGNAATYSYDAVGNLLAISRPGPAQIAIMQFNPVSGPVGASVTIHGAGFSATAGQNTVAFNGVSATVVSSSTNLIVTSVPAGATTGTIAVTSPVGSATSAGAFSVSTGAPGLPAITGFTPTVGSPGTPVTISGTNFETNTSNEKVALNITLTSPSSSSSTSIATSVPSAAGSGRISVSTPYGKAVSSADFFVPPSPHTAANVESTARMTFGETKTITVTGTSKIGLVVFDGALLQRVSLKVNTASYLGTLNINNPNGSILVATGGYIGGLFIEPQKLFSAGTYTIFNRTDYPPASITFTLYDVPPDVTNTVGIGGTPVSVATTTPGQNALVTFNGTAGQQVSLNTSSNIVAWALSVLNPDGSILGSANGPFIDSMTLPTTGAYTILVNPIDMHTGNATLTLHNVADVSGSLTIGEPPVSTTITYPGQRSRLTFSGTAGQKVSLLGTNNTMSLCTLSIQNPDDTTLAVIGGAISAAPWIDTKTLPATGVYTVVVDPQGTITGSMAVRLYDVTDVTGTITPGGSPMTVTTTTPGQNAYVTFSGTAGQRVSLTQSNGSWGTTILNPDGTTLASGGYIEAKTLATTGTYTLKVDPPYNSIGSTTLTLHDVPPDVTGTVTIGGASIPVTITAPGQNGTVTFAGTAGQVVTVRLTGNTIPVVTLRLYKPDGTQLGTIWGGGNFNLANQTLPTTGTYTVLIDPSTWNIGSLNLNVTSP